MNRKWRILHVTDLHYGSSEENSPLFVDEDKVDLPKAMRDRVVTVFHELLTAKPLAGLDAVMMTGDVADRCSEGGFKQYAETTAVALRRLLPEGMPKALCIVPGNHDVRWNLSGKAPDFFEQKFELFRHYAATNGATTCLFPKGSISGDQVDLAFDSGDPFFCDDDRHLFVLCINSAVRCGEINEARRQAVMKQIDKLSKHVKNLGKKDPITLNLANASIENIRLEIKRLTAFDVAHVTQSQRTQLARVLRKQRDRIGVEKWASYLRIAILHHHLVPFPGQVSEHKAFEPIVDAALVLDLLAAYGFQIALVGHKHHQYDVNSPHGKLLIVGGPTVGGFPARNNQQGFRLLEVETEVSGIPAKVKLVDIPIPTHAPDPDNYVTTRIKDAREIDLFHAPTHCDRAIQVQLRIEKGRDLTTVNRMKDESSLFLLFLNSHKNPKQTTLELLKYAAEYVPGSAGPRIEGIYDVFGEHDIVVKIRGEDLKEHDKNPVKKHIVDPLRQKGLLGTADGGESSWGKIVDVWNEKAVSTTELRFDPQVRAMRSFIYFRNVRSLSQVRKGCRDVVADRSNVILSGFYTAEDEAIAEYSVACGGYYDLTDIVRSIEDANISPNKTTLNVMTIYEGDWRACYDKVRNRNRERPIRI